MPGQRTATRRRPTDGRRRRAHGARACPARTARAPSGLRGRRRRPRSGPRGAAASARLRWSWGPRRRRRGRRRRRAHAGRPGGRRSSRSRPRPPARTSAAASVRNVGASVVGDAETDISTPSGWSLNRASGKSGVSARARREGPPRPIADRDPRGDRAAGPSWVVERDDGARAREELADEGVQSREQSPGATQLDAEPATGELLGDVSEVREGDRAAGRGRGGAARFEVAGRLSPPRG